jgi:ubiquinone biosynthesis O-methyltransferase
MCIRDRSLFDNAAKDYDVWFDNAVGKFVDLVETECMFSLVDELVGMRVLDIGCGTGHLSQKLCKKGAKVTGIDISEKMLEKACVKKNAKGLDIEYKKMDVYDLEFHDSTFDYVFSMAAFEFIEDMERAFTSIKRVLKDDGIIIIGTIQKVGAWANLYESPAFSETVFANAYFKGLHDFKELDGIKVMSHKDCLFVPPGKTDDKYTLENEQTIKEKGGIGGFLCVKMKKS